MYVVWYRLCRAGTVAWGAEHFSGSGGVLVTFDGRSHVARFLELERCNIRAAAGNVTVQHLMTRRESRRPELFTKQFEQVYSGQAQLMESLGHSAPNSLQ